MTTAQIYASNAATLPILGRKLHEILTAEGWQLQYASAGAIGTGSAASPAWDGTTAAASTVAGVATYLMPLSGLTNRWMIQIELTWGTNTSNIGMYTTTATGVNTSTGALTGAGRRNGSNNLVNLTVENAVSAGPYGFALIGSTGWHGIERRRDVTNTYQDDALTHQYALSGQVGFTIGARGLARNWSTGEYADQPLMFLVGLSGSGITSGVEASTLSSSDGNVGYPTGPFAASNGLGGVLRHVQTWITADSVAGVDQSIEMDGQSRLYYPMATTGPGGRRVLVAKS